MSSKHFHAGVWFTVGLGLIGAATGYFVALSRSPVVGIVLPLVFGLVGGAGGIYLAKADLKSEEGQHRLSLIGKAVGSLSLVMVATTAAMLWLFQSSTYQPLMTVSGVAQLDAKDLLSLVVLRARLQLLGASAQEQNTILASAAKANIREADPAPLIAKKLHAISTAAANVIAALNGPFSADEQKNEMIKSVLNLKQWLLAINPMVQTWADEIDKKGDVSMEEVGLAIRLMNSSLDAIIGDSHNPYPTLSALAPYPKIVQSLIALRIKLSADAPQLYSEVQLELRNLPGTNPNDIKDIIALPLRDIQPGPVSRVADEFRFSANR
jgi:hypothetical protein